MISKEELDNYLLELKNGNLDIFDEFYHKTNKYLYFNIISILKDSQLSQDILQDSYLKILESLDKYKPKTNPLAWMITISRNLSINEYNRRKREVLVNVEDNPNLYGATYNQAPKELPLIEIMNETLTKKERELIVLHDVNGLTHKEIAKIVNRPLGTVLWQYNQAIKKLQSKVGEEYE